MTINVYSVPVANADSYTVVAGNTLTVAAPGVLGNDTNADGRTLTAALGTGVSHGSLTLMPTVPSAIRHPRATPGRTASPTPR